MIWFFNISRRLIIKLIRSKWLFLWYSFTFNVVITHEIITFQDIWMVKIPKDFMSTKATYYAALTTLTRYLRITFSSTCNCNLYYHASDKLVGILLDRSRSHDSVKITVLGVEIRIGRLIEFEAGGEQSKMADDELVAMDLSWGFSFCTDF